MMPRGILGNQQIFPKANSVFRFNKNQYQLKAMIS